MITQGIYEHYKSTPETKMYYQVLFLSHDEETLEVLVHYTPLYPVHDNEVYNDGITIWTRTLKNFNEIVTWKGQTVPRFRRVDSIVEE